MVTTKHKQITKVHARAFDTNPPAVEAEQTNTDHLIILVQL